MLIFVDGSQISEFEMKLVDINSDGLGIPNTAYDARVTLPSLEFDRIVRALTELGDSVHVEVSKDAGSACFSTQDEMNGKITLKQSGEAQNDASGIQIVASKEVNLRLSLNFLVHFAKTCSLGKVVKLMMSNEAPLLV